MHFTVLSVFCLSVPISMFGFFFVGNVCPPSCEECSSGPVLLTVDGIELRL